MGSAKVRLLKDQEAWVQQVEQFISNSTKNGIARARLQHVYPSEWLYDDVEQLHRACMLRFPALPLPPYKCDLSLKSAMGCTPLDETSHAGEVRSALEAAYLLENERKERAIEEEERRTGILRAAIKGERQMVRRRVRKLALIIGNSIGPGKSTTDVCTRDAESVARRLRDLGFQTQLLTDAKKSEMKAKIQQFGQSLQDSDLVFFYFSGHARHVNGRNYLIPAEGKADHLAMSYRFPSNALCLRDDVIVPLQSAQGTLSFIVLDVFRASPAIKAPSGCGKWKEGFTDWDNRFPASFLPHLRPPGTPASFVDKKAQPSGQRLQVMEGSMDGVQESWFPLLAGGAIEQELALEDLRFRAILDKTRKEERTASEACRAEGEMHLMTDASLRRWGSPRALTSLFPSVTVVLSHQAKSTFLGYPRENTQSRQCLVVYKTGGGAIAEGRDDLRPGSTCQIGELDCHDMPD
eukprot:767903-Hanusia_phi.AAC.9